MSVKIAPSLLSADFGHLQSAVDWIEQSEADWYHVDVMDGVFVPNISFGFPVMDFLHKKASKPLDVHLMIVEPERYVERFASMGASILTVHLEASTHLHRTIQQIHQAGMQAGVAINPHTHASLLDEVLEDIQLALVMSVNPGFGGQKFIERSFKKIEYLAKAREERGLSFLIEVDGGVSDKNAKSLIDAGADVLVAGNYVFSSSDPLAAVRSLKA